MTVVTDESHQMVIALTVQEMRDLHDYMIEKGLHPSELPSLAKQLLLEEIYR